MVSAKVFNRNSNTTCGLLSGKKFLEHDGTWQQSIPVDQDPACFSCHGDRHHLTTTYRKGECRSCISYVTCLQTE